MIFSSCSDQLIEDNLAGTWELKMYVMNDVDHTADMNISGYTETYTVDGIYSRRYVDGKQQLVEESGAYSINETGRSLHISDVSSIADFSAAHSTLSTSTAEVITIDEAEFVYSFENGGDTHEFRLLRQD